MQRLPGADVTTFKIAANVAFLQDLGAVLLNSDIDVLRNVFTLSMFVERIDDLVQYLPITIRNAVKFASGQGRISRPSFCDAQVQTLFADILAHIWWVVLFCFIFRFSILCALFNARSSPFLLHRLTFAGLTGWLRISARRSPSTRASWIW